MNNNIILQYIALSVIFIFIVAYFVFSIRKSIKNNSDQNCNCSGCSLKDSCSSTSMENSHKNTKKCAKDIANSKK